MHSKIIKATKAVRKSTGHCHHTRPVTPAHAAVRLTEECRVGLLWAMLERLGRVADGIEALGCRP
jgi:hypothetical protein